jgi:hypothetical protein
MNSSVCNTDGAAISEGLALNCFWLYN